MRQASATTGTTHPRPFIDVVVLISTLSGKMARDSFPVQELKRRIGTTLTPRSLSFRLESPLSADRNRVICPLRLPYFAARRNRAMFLFQNTESRIALASLVIRFFLLTKVGCIEQPGVYPARFPATRIFPRAAGSFFQSQRFAPSVPGLRK